MPWKLKGKCVHKVNTDGTLGPVVPGGCHQSRAEARKHQQALYRNVKEAGVGDTVTVTTDDGNTAVFHMTSNTTNTPTAVLNPSPQPIPVPTTPEFDFATTWPSGYAPIRLYFAEGERTVDNRVIDPNAMNFNRQPPLPIRLQTRQPESGGHAGAELSGVILNLARDGHIIIADGFLDLSLEAGRTMAQLAHNQTLQTWSPDIGDPVIDTEINYTDEDANTPQDKLKHVRSCTLIGCTAVALPALGGAMFELLNEDGTVMVAAPHREGPQINPVGVSTDPEEHKIVTDRTMERFTADGQLDEFALNAAEELIHLSIEDFAERKFPTSERKKMAKKGVAMPGGRYPIPDADALRRATQAIGRAKPADRAKVKAHIRKRAKALGKPVPKGAMMSSIAACAGPDAPPAEWFSDPGLTELSQFLTITADGHVFGHLCPWDACHIGYQGVCVSPPKEDDYSYFRVGQVRTADGTLVATGPIALNGGHASRSFSADKAQAHYDNPDTAIMDVAVGPDDNGIWFSGALRPDVTPAQVHRLQASGVSGDWREIDGELRLIGICSVNVPGFPKVRLVASGEEEPHITALVGMGTNPELTDCETCEEYSTEQEIADLHAEVAELRELVAAVQPSTWDDLESRVTEAVDPFLELTQRAGLD